MFRIHEIKKVYYEIGEVAKMLDEYPNTILYWCKKVGILPRRMGGGSKRLSVKLRSRDVESLKEIRTMLRDDGKTISDVKMINKKR